MKSILITGAGSGIGLATTEYLAAQQYQVFACVRKPDDISRLKQSITGNVIGVLCDVTDQASILAAQEQVSTLLGNAGLDGLINNAGIAYPCPLEYSDQALFERIMQTNLYGPMWMIQAFLPLLRKAKGRIVNVSSTAAFLQVPSQGAYSASKAALEACSNVLRAELASIDVTVTVVQPGYIEGPIHNIEPEQVKQVLAMMPDDGVQRYQPMLTEYLNAGKQQDKFVASMQDAAVAIHKAIEVKNPKASYVFDTTSRLLKLSRWLMGDWILEKVRLSLMK